MAYALNPSHPLAGNVVELIGVQTGALVSTRTARSFTRHPNASYTTGGFYGEAFRTIAAGYAVQGAVFSPAVVMDTAAMTLFIVTNSLSTANGVPPYPMVSSTQGSYQPSIGMTTNGKAVAVATYGGAGGGVVSGTTVNVGAHSMALTRTGDSKHELYVDGALQGTGGQLGWTTASGIWDTIGGASGHSSVTEDLVWIVWFNKILSVAEIASLHAGLSAGNGFTLVGSGGGAGTPTVTGVTVSPATATVSGAATRQFSATVAGTNNPSQTVTWSTSAGSISSTGLFTAPAAGAAVQTITVTATSVANSAFSGSATVTVPAASAGGQLLTEGMINNTGQVLANLSVRWSWFPGGRIGTLTGITPIEGTGVTNAQGQLLATGLPAGPGLLLVAQWVTNASDDKIYYMAGVIS